MFEIVDSKTKQVVGRAKTLASASRVCDRRDNEYGAVRYFSRRIPVLCEPELVPDHLAVDDLRILL